LRAARAAELDASDEDDAARAALATIEATLAERETELASYAANICIFKLFHKVNELLGESLA
jgi:hypothetical protein